jgi:hypothetical protein
MLLFCWSKDHTTFGFIDMYLHFQALQRSPTDGVTPADEETSNAADDSLSRGRSRPLGNRGRFLSRTAFPKSEIRPTPIERRARLVNAIAGDRRWLDEIVSGAVNDVQQIAARQKCSVRQVNMTISLAFLAPDSCAPRSKVVCHAALESNGCVMPQQNGASSSKLSIKSEINCGPGSKKRRAFGPQDSGNSRQPTGIGRQRLPPGTEFLDAETGG